MTDLDREEVRKALEWWNRNFGQYPGSGQPEVRIIAEVARAFVDGRLIDRQTLIRVSWCKKHRCTAVNASGECPMAHHIEPKPTCEIVDAAVGEGEQ